MQKASGLGRYFPVALRRSHGPAGWMCGRTCGYVSVDIGVHIWKLVGVMWVVGYRCAHVSVCVCGYRYVCVQEWVCALVIRIGHVGVLARACPRMKFPPGVRSRFYKFRLCCCSYLEVGP